MAISSSEENPSTNVLGAGVLESAVMKAIERSGYPLQTTVAELLRKSFKLHEEWSYIDRDTKALRSVDILASKRLYDIKDHKGRVRPQLDLIIECKKSDLPFIFFSTSQKLYPYDFPKIAGLPHRTIELVTDDDLSTWSLRILDVIGMDNHSFVHQSSVANTFSKCVRRSGSELELSGEESYNNVVLPLIKATSHFEFAESPKDTAWYFDAHLAIPVAVVDAPMILLKMIDGKNQATLKPWVRVARHEYERDTKDWEKNRLWMIDVVHIDYLNTYIEQHLLPFANEFATLALQHNHIIASGKGFVSGLEKIGLKGIVSRLRPRPITNRVSRTSSMAWRILTLPYWLWKEKPWQ